MTDFLIINHGSIVTFKPLTPKARRWWKRNTDDTEFCAANHCAEARYADDIYAGIVNDGLTVN
jgi:hypothetical protein